MIILHTLALLLAVAGSVLYLASYFEGGLLLIGALMLEGFAQWKKLGKTAFIQQLKGIAQKSLVPVVGIAVALVIGAIIMALTGYDPVKAYEALFYGGLVKNWHVSVLNAVPLIFTGLAITFAFQGGLFNIGAEGQYYIGVIVSTWLGLTLNPSLPSWFGIVLIYLAAMLAGALLNVVPALLKVKTGAHEVVTTMMLAYTVRTLSPLFIRAFGGDPVSSSHPLATDAIKDRFWLPLFQTILPEANYRLHIGIILAILTAFATRYLVRSTNLGYKIRALGYNPKAAKTYGISVGWMTTITLLISGALAAMAGATQVLGLDHRMFQDLNAGYGWNGISIALLARNNPVAIIFTALLWGALDAGGQYMARVTHTPNAIIEIIKGVILFLLLSESLYEQLKKYGFWQRLGRRKQKEVAA